MQEIRKISQGKFTFYSKLKNLNMLYQLVFMYIFIKSDANKKLHDVNDDLRSTLEKNRTHRSSNVRYDLILNISS